MNGVQCRDGKPLVVVVVGGKTAVDGRDWRAGERQSQMAFVDIDPDEIVGITEGLKQKHK